jgi:hypothetical protein
MDVVPFAARDTRKPNRSSKKIRDGGLWHVHEFAWQMDAILFWDRFRGRWLLGSVFHYPKRLKDLLPLKEPVGARPFRPSDAGYGLQSARQA